MNGPSALWGTKLIVFDKEISLIQNVVLSTARDSLVALINRIDYLYSLIEVWGEKIYPPITPEIPYTIHDIFMHQGLAANIMFNKSIKGKSESGSHYRLRVERAEYVDKYLVDAKLNIFPNKRLRNKLAHADEAIEAAMQEQNTGWFVDACVGTRDEYSVPTKPDMRIAFCRCYIISENVISHLGEEVNLTALREEASIILAHVFGVSTQPPRLSPAHIHQEALARRSQSRA